MKPMRWLQDLPTQDGWRTLGKRAPRFVALALAFAIAAQAAVIAVDLTRWTGGLAPRLATPGSTGTGRRQAFDVAQVVSAHLFGAAPVADAAAPATTKPLVLSGIVAVEDPARGLAILGETTSNTRLYAVGGTVPGGAQLRAVYSDRIILDRNGSLESLMLPRGAGTGSAPAVARGLARSSATPGDPEREKPTHLAMMDSHGFGELLKSEPVFKGDKQRGYRLYPGKNLMAFVRLGLQSGDVVTAINGTDLDDPARGQQMLRALDSTSEAHFTVTRNGRTKDLVLNLAELADAGAQPVGAGGMPP